MTINQQSIELTTNIFEILSKEEKINLALIIISQKDFFKKIILEPLADNKIDNQENVRKAEMFVSFVKNEMMWKGFKVKHDYAGHRQIVCSLEWKLAQLAFTYTGFLLNGDYSNISLDILLEDQVLPDGNKLPSIAEILIIRGISFNATLINREATLAFINALKQSMQGNTLNKYLLIVNLIKNEIGYKILTNNNFNLLDQLVKATASKVEKFNFAYFLLKTYLGYKLLSANNYKLGNLLIPNEDYELIAQMLKLTSVTIIDINVIRKLINSEFGRYILFCNNCRLANLLISADNIADILIDLCEYETGLKILAANNFKLAQLISREMLSNQSAYYIQNLYDSLNKYDTGRKILRYNNDYLEDLLLFHPNRITLQEYNIFDDLSVFSEDEQVVSNNKKIKFSI